MNYNNKLLRDSIVNITHRTVRLVGEEIFLAGLNERAIISIKNLPIILNYLKKSSQHAIVRELKALHRLSDMSEKDSDMANSLLQQDYHRIHAHAIISLWGYIEAGLDDMSNAIFKLCSQDDLYSESILDKYRDCLPAGNDLIAANLKRKILNTIKKHYNSNYIVTNEILFKFLSVDFNNTETTLSKMQEINSMRNCLLHSTGHIDEYALAVSPGLPFKPGDLVVIGRDQFSNYLSVIIEYVTNFNSRLLESKYMFRV